MGKLGRFACIFVPWAMTLAALVLLVIVQLGGKSTGTGILSNVRAWQADFSNVTIGDNPNAVQKVLRDAQNSGKLLKFYQIHIHNYCSSNSSVTSTDYCSDFENGFVFDFVNKWGLNATGNVKRQGQVSDPQDVQTKIKNVLGDGVAKSLDTYKSASKWMSIAFTVALWTAVATCLVAIAAIFSRWGSFVTWILSIVSTLFSFGASITASVVYGSLVGALRTAFKDTKVSIDLGGTFLALIWISTALSVGATVFWLISICLCSGKSNPHHKSNKGGLWEAEPKDPGYGSRGMHVEQTGGYQRVASPYAGTQDRVPLNEHPAPMPMGGQPHSNGAYEPYRYQN